MKNKYRFHNNNNYYFLSERILSQHIHSRCCYLRCALPRGQKKRMEGPEVSELFQGQDPTRGVWERYGDWVALSATWPEMTGRRVDCVILSLISSRCDWMGEVKVNIPRGAHPALIVLKPLLRTLSQRFNRYFRAKSFKSLFFHK